MILLGWILIVFGSICIVIGITVAVVVALQRLADEAKKPFVDAVDEGVFSLAKVIVEFLRELLKQPGGVFLVVGLILFGAGFYIIVIRTA